MKQYLNSGYAFCKGFDPDLDCPGDIELPHPAVYLPHHYYSSGDYQGQFTYATCFDDEFPELPSKLLRFEGAMLKMEVLLNGEILGKFISGFLPVDIDVTGKIKRKGNRLVVLLDSNEDAEIPPFGNVVDYLTYAGLYRGVCLISQHESHLSDIYARGNSKGEIFVEAYDESGERTEDIKCTLYLDKQRLVDFKGSKGRLFEPKAYSPSSPTLYLLEVNYGEEKYRQRLAFLDYSWTKDGFFLNGERLKLIGLNRHQSYPYFGSAAPKALQEDDARLLKELGINLVRTSHYPQSEDFLSACDELGLFVIDEIPGWQHIGTSKKWRETELDFCRRMIRKERNHPCLIGYGLRIDESPDDHELYSALEKIKSELDPYRPSLGVRNFIGSEQLEDIYAYNDFSCSSTKHGLINPRKYGDKSKAKMVSEHNGHMFPTKMTDRDERRDEQALRHLRVLDDGFKYKSLSAVVGWCAFDYGTHMDFGSGDMICYHGVFSIFRNKKEAAYAYESQFASHDVVYIGQSLDLGDSLETLLPERMPIYTNADKVTLYRGDMLVGDFFPARKLYPHLPHPPVFIDSFIPDAALPKYMKGLERKRVKKVLAYASSHGLNALKLRHKLAILCSMVRHRLKFADLQEIYVGAVGIWGNKRLDYRFEFYRDGKKFKTIIKSPCHYSTLEITASKTSLEYGKTFDAARVQIRRVDENGNLLHLDGGPISLQAKGPIRIMGPECICLEGGAGAVYVASMKVKSPQNAVLLLKEGDREYSIGFLVG